MSDDDTTTTPSAPSTSGDPDSITSEETVASPDASPRLALGREIVRALSGERAGVLERWMGHHIAELMERVDAAAPGAERDRAEAACRTAILDVWSKRESWPYGAPLERVMEALSGIARPEETAWVFQPRPTQQDGWFGLLDALDAAGDQETAIVWDAGAAMMDLDDERATLHAGHLEATSDEHKLLTWLTNQNDAAAEPKFSLGSVAAPGFREMSLPDQAEVIQQAFAAVAQQRARAVTRALEHLAGVDAD